MILFWISNVGPSLTFHTENSHGQTDNIKAQLCANIHNPCPPQEPRRFSSILCRTYLGMLHQLD